MNILQQDNTNVKNKASVLSLGVKDKALQGCNLSVTSSPPGESTLAFFMSSHTFGNGRDFRTLELDNSKDQNDLLDQRFDHVIKTITDQLPGSEDNSWGVISEKPINQLCAAPLNFGFLQNLEGDCLE